MEEGEHKSNMLLGNRSNNTRCKRVLLLLACFGLALIVSLSLIECGLPKVEEAKAVARDYGNEDEELFEDAIDHWGDQDESASHQDDQDEDVFYDAKEEFEEEDDTEVCSIASRYECASCCSVKGFTKPFFDKLIGQCKCYQKHADSNACSQAKEAQACETCCKSSNFDTSDYFRSACYCSDLS